ncbi:hypothetical protein J421_0866 [Gemmatirosa kalamazoonensis]|uniref:Uncharacterized protein n=1 Tax=Gemmatirosa kalamazoonensis TaxID=861299 RepID=W0RG83_9BACT|nr:hypothetical protein [Gemmatirosa kalamazoonensis]AHG88403.1 hypothetical protein J421_0866 [Gemmatirosa kalamazoonensis]
MRVAYVTAAVQPSVDVAPLPWVWHHDALAARGIDIVHVDAASPDAFGRAYDAMILHVWLDWKNPRRFVPSRILPVMEAYAAYRARFPETVQIVLNHTDMSRRPYATPYWRPGDPVLYRTPAYDRAELAPFPAESIHAYEKVWGAPRFVDGARPRGGLGVRRRARVLLGNLGTASELARAAGAALGGRTYAAGFVGQPTGPRGYRERVARETARVGVGLCVRGHFLDAASHDALMARCRIIVCPRGWGEQSARHWDAWRSGKPVLTDRDCDAVEMIPGCRLRAGVHYLVYDDPRDIPDLVTDWTRPSRRDDLDAIAAAGRAAAEDYDALGRIERFLRVVVPNAAPSARRAAGTPGRS